MAIEFAQPAVAQIWCAYPGPVLQDAYVINKLKHPVIPSYQQMSRASGRVLGNIDELEQPIQTIKINQIHNLVDGFNPFEKNQSNWESSPHRGENKKYLKLRCN